MKIKHKKLNFCVASVIFLLFLLFLGQMGHVKNPQIALSDFQTCKHHLMTAGLHCIKGIIPFVWSCIQTIFSGKLV